ncbi:MAG: hypothetical protein WCC25_07270 [Candidatus Korobacteraceae bacterium]
MASLTGTDGNGSGIAPPTTFGVWGDSQTGDGVLGTASTPTSGANSGVHGIYQQPSGITPYLDPTAGCGVWGDSSDSPGVFGSSSDGDGVDGFSTFGDGVVGVTYSPNSVGVFGVNGSTADGDVNVGIGVLGFGDCGVQALGDTFGIQCISNAVGMSINAGEAGDPGGAGIQINAPGEGGAGAVVSAENGFGALIFGEYLGLMVSTTEDLSAVFFGDVGISGHLLKFGGGYQIDHPLSPDSKILNHSFVESSERKNIYDGVVKLDAKGTARVKLPAWFEAVNGSFRYQLTSIGAPAPNLHVSKKISKGRFQIAGGKPRSEVSWQVTGVRTDPWAKANPLVVEEKKRSSERGYYLDPLLYKKPEEKRIFWKRHPEASKRMNEVVNRRGAQVEEVLNARKQKFAARLPHTPVSGQRMT